jgi:subtilisin family serine protease
MKTGTKVLLVVGALGSLGIGLWLVRAERSTSESAAVDTAASSTTSPSPPGRDPVPEDARASSQGKTEAERQEGGLAEAGEDPKRPNVRQPLDHGVTPHAGGAGAGSAKGRPRKLTAASHVAFLLSLGVQEARTIRRADGREERLSLIKDEGGRFLYLVVHELANEPGGPPSSSFVQVGGEVLVRFKAEPSRAELERFLEDHQLGLGQKMLLERSYLLTTSDVSLGRLLALEAALADDARLEGAEPNIFRYLSLVPNDPSFKFLWGMQNSGADPTNTRPFKKDLDLDAAPAWDMLTDCSQTVVAVLDSGVDATHPDLRGNIMTALGRSFVPGTAATDFTDSIEHGTHVSGTIGAIGNNGQGVAGVCWKAAIIPIKVGGADGLTIDSIINGLMYAAQSPAKVLNMSFGGPGAASPQEASALDAVTRAGKLMVIAAGNENSDNDTVSVTPASYQTAGKIVVAAMHGGGELADFSNFGLSSVDIAAPGQDILSTIPLSQVQNDATKAYAYLSGTSMATPMVTGAVALFWSYAPELSAKQVKDLVLASATKESFAKKIVGGRRLSLAAVMEAVKARVAVRELEAGRLTVKGGRGALSLTPQAPYAKIARVEILSDGKVLATANGGATAVDLPLPQLVESLPLQVRVTDEKGRVSLSPSTSVKIGVEKILDFSQLELDAVAGPVTCKLVRIDAAEEQVLLEAGVASEETCKTLCAMAGPLAHSSLATIRCGAVAKVFYEKASPP